MRTYAPNFSKDELLKFLQAVDDSLSEPVELTIIGGAAAALHYGATQVTNDIDTWERLTSAFLKAVREATEKTEDGTWNTTRPGRFGTNACCSTI
jgi:hypothetical protein